MHFTPTMQRNVFYGPGTQNNIPYVPLQPPLQQNIGQNPEIIGEGDVTSVVLPNGSVQYLFVPILKRDLWPPYMYNPNPYTMNLTSQAWFVRSFSNPLTPTFYRGQQLLRPPYGDPFVTNFMVSDINSQAPALGYYNTFHYDKCTSTTDLHYFYPCFEQSRSCHKSSANVQLDSPMQNQALCVYEVLKPCICTVNRINSMTMKCETEKPQREKTQSKKTQFIQTQSQQTQWESSRHKTVPEKGITSMSSGGIQCECITYNNSDIGIATIDCKVNRHQETETCKNNKYTTDFGKISFKKIGKLEKGVTTCKLPTNNCSQQVTTNDDLKDNKNDCQHKMNDLANKPSEEIVQSINKYEKFDADNIQCKRKPNRHESDVSLIEISGYCEGGCCCTSSSSSSSEVEL